MSKKVIKIDQIIVSEKNADLFNWLLKYDPTFKGNKKVLCQELIDVALEHLYVEGLKNIDPLDEDIQKYLSAQSIQAFKSATSIDRREDLKNLEKKAIKENKNNAKVRKLVLTHGGEFVQIWTNEDASFSNAILSRAFLQAGNLATLKLGKPNQCHHNAATLWAKNKKKYSIITGFALSTDDDGVRLWRQHSWIQTNDGKVLESTLIRDCYFGYRLTTEEAAIFSSDNIDNDLI